MSWEIENKLNHISIYDDVAKSQSFYLKDGCKVFSQGSVITISSNGSSFTKAQSDIKTPSSTDIKDLVDQVYAYINSPNEIIPPYIPTAVPQTISGPGAVTISEYKTEITTTGADAFTLVDGTVIGALKKIKLIVSAGNATLTPTSLSGGTVITFSVVGDEVTLMWDGNNWMMIDDSSVLGTGATPVLT